jgi:hypothetical protein
MHLSLTYQELLLLRTVYAQCLFRCGTPYVVPVLKRGRGRRCWPAVLFTVISLQAPSGLHVQLRRACHWLRQPGVLLLADVSPVSSVLGL